MSKTPDTQPGRYTSTTDASTRRVYWHTTGTGKQLTRTLYAARTRPGRPEEEPYEILESFLSRLVSFGIWVREG